MILLIDNYDSFTYNVYQMVGCLNSDIMVRRNDAITCDEIDTLKPSHIIISPGPGFPSSAGVSIDVIRRFGSSTPLLGICLGHQAIAQAYGGKIVHAPALMHGKSSENTVDTANPLFSGLPEKVTVARYHSLIAEHVSLPDCLTVTAKTDDGLIMAISHKEYPVYGVQFHPESILTKNGEQIFRNFLKIS